MITAEPSSRAMTISFTIWIRTDQFRIRKARHMPSITSSAPSQILKVVRNRTVVEIDGEETVFAGI